MSEKKPPVLGTVEFTLPGGAGRPGLAFTPEALAQLAREIVDKPVRAPRGPGEPEVLIGTIVAAELVGDQVECRAELHPEFGFLDGNAHFGLDSRVEASMVDGERVVHEFVCPQVTAASTAAAGPAIPESVSAELRKGYERASNAWREFSVDPGAPLTEAALEKARNVALNALAASGIDPSRVVLGLAGDPDENGDTHYELHVGPTEDRDRAGMLNYVAKAVAREADHQIMALIGDETCPACSSPRYGLEWRKGEPMRPEQWWRCMACGHAQERGGE